MAPRRDELFVSSGSGLLQQISWNGLLEGEMTVSIHNIPFTNDLENARGTVQYLVGSSFQHSCFIADCLVSLYTLPLKSQWEFFWGRWGAKENDVKVQYSCK